MSSKSERESARRIVVEYHQAQLTVLVEHVAEAIDRFRAGTINGFEADEVMFQYSRAAKELWKFCNDPDLSFTADLIRDNESVDWWNRGTPKRR